MNDERRAKAVALLQRHEAAADFIAEVIAARAKVAPDVEGVRPFDPRRLMGACEAYLHLCGLSTIFEPLENDGIGKRLNGGSR